MIVIVDVLNILLSYDARNKLQAICCGAVAQSVKRPLKDPYLVRLYLTDVGSNPERGIFSSISLSPRRG